MNIPLMKYADENLGKAACFLLSLTGKKKQAKLNNEDVKNILLVKFWGMGSIILTTPALRNIREEYKNAKIYYLTLENNKDICNLIKEIDEVFYVKLKNPFSFTLDTLKKILQLRKIKFDIVFDFEFFTYYSSLIVKLINTRSAAGFNNLKNNRNKLFSETVIFDNMLHARDNFLKLVSSSCRISSDEFSSLLSETNSGGYDSDKPYIIVNPNASSLAYERRLPAKDFVTIIEHLQAKKLYKIFLTGLKEESEYVGNIFNSLQQSEGVSNLCGALTVKELAELLSGSLCLITNDSGPLHLASSLNVPTISFFGPESPEKYGPLSAKKLVFYQNLPCSPCMSISNSKTVNCIFSEPKCMTQFNTSDLLNKTDNFISSLLEEKAKPAEENIIG
jgi:ADP-heptose:LPS heptosyltransferase